MIRAVLFMFLMLASGMGCSWADDDANVSPREKYQKVVISSSLQDVIAPADQQIFNRLDSGCSRQVRVVVAQKGPYKKFKDLMRAFFLKLNHDGLLDLPISDAVSTSFEYDDPAVWEQLAAASAESCVTLLRDGLYNAEWDSLRWEPMAESLQKRLLEKKDVDVVIGIGVAAGLKFADSKYGIPVMIIDASSPEEANIIGPGEFSDKPNVHVQKYPKRIPMSIKTYYDIFKFKNLGMIADTNIDFRNMQSFNAVLNTAKEVGFNLHYCLGDLNNTDVNIGISEFVRCRDEIIDKVDAVFIATVTPVGTHRFCHYIRPFLDKDLVVISEGKLYEVNKGALISLIEEDFDDCGRFEADVFEKIYYGAKPEEISQYYHTNLVFALNLQTAKMVNWKPSFELLMSVGYLFDTIDYK